MPEIAYMGAFREDTLEFWVLFDKIQKVSDVVLKPRAGNTVNCQEFICDSGIVVLRNKEIWHCMMRQSRDNR